MITSIHELDSQQIQAMIDELSVLDKNLYKKVQYVVNSIQCSEQEALEYVVNNAPALWAKVYLNWEARDYQFTILDQGKKGKKIVLRLGRRLGKTECMCVLILWHAFTQVNKGGNNQYDILIITPYETQVDLIFDRLHQLIDISPILKVLVKRDVYHRIEFTNGSKIVGLTAGSKSGSGAANTRGQRADLIVMDEIDYMTSSDITNIVNIRNEDPERIKLLVASTPSGKHEEFYKWCVGASHKYYPSKHDIDNFQFTGFLESHNTDGNGWVEVYAPSIVNKALLKINKDTGQTYLQDLKDELTEMRFVQEVLAEFGEEEMGVYQKKYIEQALAEGKRINHKYTTDFTDEELKEYLRKPRSGPRILGIDWDKFGASTNMACMELDKFHINEAGEIEPKFKVLFRVEIPRSEFTYVNAINKIIALNEIYDFDHIAVDRGYGETQIELLRKYGMDNPETGLADKVVGYQFSQKLEVRDPHTGKKDKKPLKPFMVNNSVILYEKGKIILNPNDDVVVEQLGNYRVKSISANGIPTFNDDDEHIVDAINLALLAFEQHYGELMRRVVATKAYFIQGFKGHEEKLVEERNIKEPERKSTVAVLSNRTKSKVVQVVPINPGRRSNTGFSRRTF